MRKGWIKIKLGSILEIERGGSPRPIKNFLTNDPDGINWIKIGDTKGTTKYIRTTKEKIKPAGLKKSRLVVEGDFILSNSMSFGKPYIMDTKGAIHDGWLVLRNKEGIEINKDFLYYVLSSPSVYNQFERLAAGSTVKNLNIGLVSSVIINLIPLPEQRAIVGKIEQLFSELDNGIANLKAAREKLDIYRQAVLKKAFEGELTREWRNSLAQDGKRLPDAQDLLEQIKAERKAYYQQQIKAWQQSVIEWDAQGRKGKKPGKPKKLESLHNLFQNELKEIPANWNKVNIEWLLSLNKKGMTTGPFGTLLKKSEHKHSGIPVLGIENIGEGVFKMPNKIFVSEGKSKELASFQVEFGDIIISRSGTVGEICMVPDYIGKALISTNLIRVSLNPDVIDSKYFVYLFQGGVVRDQVRELCVGSTRDFLNQNILKSIGFPLPSKKEQHQIVQEIETRLSVCDKLGASIDESLEKAEALRQSILKKAFEGKLLSEAELAACRQAPDWEPAGQLLERIKGKKEAVQGKLFEKLSEQDGKD